MREVESIQFEIGATPISEINISTKSRDDIPALLIGLKHLYTLPHLREQVFALLDAEVNPNARKDTGRPGMELWRILVLAILKQGLKCDYDRITHIANHDNLVRQMMGHGQMVCRDYELQTVKDNVNLLSPQLLSKINQLLVQEGQKVAGKKPGETLRGRCDSFVVATDVHYPTDTNLLWDAMRCSVRVAASLSVDLNIGGWRQHKHITKTIKNAFNRVRTSKRIKKSPRRLKQYLSVCQKYLERAQITLNTAQSLDLSAAEQAKSIQLQAFIEHAHRQIDQVTRRLINGETIPHEEKVFSIFQPHTRWICKGKAGVPQELGVPVCVVEDQFKFILHHDIFWQGGDVDHAVAVIAQAQDKFPQLAACSFDKGFHSPANQIELAEMLDQCALPKKGYLSVEARAHQDQQWFKDDRKRHPGVESAINHLEHCGLDRVRDHGRKGFARAAALSVLAANLKRLGRILREKQRKKLARQQKLRAA